MPKVRHLRLGTGCSLRLSKIWPANLTPLFPNLIVLNVCDSSFKKLISLEKLATLEIFHLLMHLWTSFRSIAKKNPGRKLPDKGRELPEQTQGVFWVSRETPRKKTPRENPSRRNTHGNKTPKGRNSGKKNFPGETPQSTSRNIREETQEVTTWVIPRDTTRDVNCDWCGEWGAACTLI